MKAEEIMQKHIDPHCFLKDKCYEACIDAMIDFAKYHVEKYKEYILREGDTYIQDYPINQKIVTLIINRNKLNSYNLNNIK